MKFYVRRYRSTGSEYWCIHKTLKLARKYMESIYHTSDGFFSNPPDKIYSLPLAVSVLDPYRNVLYEERKCLT
jgi:hypothetical protein